MFWWLFGKKRVRDLEEKSEKAFSAVKKDIEAVGNWIKHLDKQDKHLSDLIIGVRSDLASINEEIGNLNEAVEIVSDNAVFGQLSKKLGVGDKQTAVGGVYDGVQTAVQTGNFYGFLKGLTANERLLVLTLANNDMKLSYEDLALLLGKERSTVRGQINSIKQKSEGMLIEEIIEKNGKKRVFVPENVRDKLAKYVKVRVGGKKKAKKSDENE